jgi:hypothetical protein
MLKKITDADAKLLTDLSEETRTNTSIAKHTGEDRGDLKFYKTSDGKRSFLRVCETILPGEGRTGSAKHTFTLYEIMPALGNPVAPSILDAK